MKKQLFFLLAVSNILWSCGPNSKKDAGVELRHKNIPEGFYEEVIPYDLFASRFNQNINSEIILAKNEIPSSSKQGIIYINTWNDLYLEALVKPEVNYLGLNVSNFEINDMIYGKNIALPLKKLPFLIDKEGNFQPHLAKNFKNKIENDTASAPRLTWEVFLRKIINDHRLTKLRSILENVSFVTPIETEFYYNYLSKEIDFEYAYRPFATIDIKVPHDSLIYNLYKAYEKDYYKSEYRKINYVTAKPQIDSANHTEELERFMALKHHLNSDFKTLASKNKNIKHFTTEYELTTVRGQLKPFFEKGKPNDSYGPFYSANSFQIVKIIEQLEIPDSVEVQHILLRDKDTIHTSKIINTILENDNFTEMVAKYSVDKQKTINNGYLGWLKYKELIEPLNSACFSAPKNIFYVVDSKHGRHIIRSINKSETSKKYVLTEGLYMELEPNESDLTNLKKDLDNLVSNSKNGNELFVNAVKMGYATTNITLENTFYNFPDIDNSLDMVQWCFKNNQGAVSKPFKKNNQYYVMSISQIIPTGIMPFEEVQDFVHSDFVILTRKDTLFNQINPLIEKDKTIYQNAKTLGSEVITIKGMKLASYDIANIGVETTVKGILAGLDVGETSNLFIGDKGLFIVKKLAERINSTHVNPFDKINKQYLSAIQNDIHISDIAAAAKTYMHIAREEDSYLLLKNYNQNLPNDTTIAQAMLDAEYAFRNKQWEIALKGSDKFQGFESIFNLCDQETVQKRLIKIYASICYMHTKQYEKAQSMLLSIDPMQDYTMSAVVPMLIADTYAFMNDIDKAIMYYSKAADLSKSKFYDGIILHKLTLSYIKTGNNTKALEACKELLNKNLTHYNGQITEEIIEMLKIRNNE